MKSYLLFIGFGLYLVFVSITVATVIGAAAVAESQNVVSEKEVKK